MDKKKFDDLVNFTNIDKKDFTGYWGEEEFDVDPMGNPRKISLENKGYDVPAGMTLKNIARFKAEAFAQHLAERMLIDKGATFDDSNSEKKVLMDKMITETSTIVEAVNLKNESISNEFPELEKLNKSKAKSL